MSGKESKESAQGLQAQQHARKALSHLLNEKWSDDVLRLVRDELGQAYFLLKKQAKTGASQCNHGIEDTELYRTLLILVNSAIANQTLRPIPVVIEKLKNNFSSKKQTYHSNPYTSNEGSVTNGLR